jgi:molybdenum cofactor cytidylyltransferase
VSVQPLILAAGASSRMGSPKAALTFGSHTALSLILEVCRQLGLQEPVVVVGAHPHVADGLGASAQVVVNPGWARGRTTSIQIGIGALDPSAEAFLVWPVDVCLPSLATVGALLAARQRQPLERLGWVPSCEQRRGHPLLLARPVAPRLLALGPDDPARDVVRALDREGLLEHVPVDDPSVLWDMNTPADYRRLLDEHARRASP